MVGLGIGGFRNKSSKILILECLQSLIDVLCIHRLIQPRSSMEGPFHDHGNNYPFPVRTIKLTHRFVPIPQFLHDLDSRRLILRENAAELHKKPITDHTFSKLPDIRVCGGPRSKERDVVIDTISRFEGRHNSIWEALHEDIS